MSSPSLLVVAGEPSGDAAAAGVVAQIKERITVDCFGIGGERLRALGTYLTAHIETLATIGIGDTLSRIAAWSQAWIKLREEINTHRPNTALLVDAPDINLPLARILTNMGCKVVFYIGPQVWAWREHRLDLLKTRTDIVALVLPFERPIYDAAGVKAAYVGHPLLDNEPALSRGKTRTRLGIDERQQVVALLPGSRPKEIQRHWPILLGTAKRLREQGVIPVLAPSIQNQTESMQHHAEAAGVSMISERITATDLLAAADAALVTSGTATLEAALHDVPMGVFYQTDPLSYLFGKHVLKIPHIALPNWILDAPLVPERLQKSVTERELNALAMHLLTPKEAQRQQVGFRRIRQLLGQKGPAKQVASLVLERLG